MLSTFVFLHWLNGQTWNFFQDYAMLLGVVQNNTFHVYIHVLEQVELNIPAISSSSIFSANVTVATFPSRLTVEPKRRYTNTRQVGFHRDLEKRKPSTGLPKRCWRGEIEADLLVQPISLEVTLGFEGMSIHNGCVPCSAKSPRPISQVKLF